MSDEKLYNPLDCLRIENDKVVFISGGSFGGSDNEEEFKTRVSETVLKFYDAEKFIRHVRGFCAWLGRKGGFQSLQNSTSGEDFEAAISVVYDELLECGAVDYFSRLAPEKFDKYVVLFVGLSPLGFAFLKELMDKKKAEKAGVTPVLEPVKEEKINE